jgi:hypothetical protein
LTSKEEYEEKQKRLEAIANPIMQKLYGIADGSKCAPPLQCNAPATKEFWISRCRVALRRYKPSASLSIAALESFIMHLQNAGDEGGTCRLVLKEDCYENLFELGSSVRFSLSVPFPSSTFDNSRLFNVCTLPAILSLTVVMNSKLLSRRRSAWRKLRQGVYYIKSSLSSYAA